MFDLTSNRADKAHVKHTITVDGEVWERVVLWEDRLSEDRLTHWLTANLNSPGFDLANHDWTKAQ